jgi:hypothetical protein
MFFSKTKLIMKYFMEARTRTVCFPFRSILKAVHKTKLVLWVINLFSYIALIIMAKRAEINSDYPELHQGLWMRR